MGSKNIFFSYLYMFLLLAFSGNPFFSPTDDYFSKFTLTVVVGILALRHYAYFDFKSGRLFYITQGFIIFIFCLQHITLGFVSITGIFGFMLKITFGYLVIRYLSVNFRLIYFNLIFFICAISLIGYLWNIFLGDIPALYIIKNSAEYSDNSGRNILVFHQLVDGSRNSGMFWEPGAFAGYINLSFLFFIGQIRRLINFKKIQCFIIFLALVTTYSTTGYLVLFSILGYTLYKEFYRSHGFLVVPLFMVLLSAGIFIYNESPFLKEKVQLQYNLAIEREKDEFAPDRISALFFDTQYILKHPLTGNGLHSKTRYADHPWLIGQTLGHGNGFSNFLASMGVLVFVGYSFLIIKYNSSSPWFFLAGVVVILQGEPLMNFPLFLSLPFIFIYEKYNSRFSYLS